MFELGSGYAKDYAYNKDFIEIIYQETEIKIISHTSKNIKLIFLPRLDFFKLKKHPCMIPGQEPNKFYYIDIILILLGMYSLMVF